MLWFAGYTLVLNIAERHLDAGTTAMLVNVAPLLVALVAGVVLKEGFPSFADDRPVGADSRRIPLAACSR